MLLPVLFLVSQAAALPPLPAPMGVPKPGPAGDVAYAPQPILPGGVIVPLWPAGSPMLKADKVREPEVYNMSQVVPGRIQSIVSIHNPSIEFHPVERGLNTGAVIILAAGGGHNTLNVGNESADWVPFFFNYGINTVILRNRLRRDGYEPHVDGVNDALQAIRMVRAYAKQWNLDPAKIGIMGFSAGAELASAASVKYPEFEKAHAEAGDPLAGVSARPDWAGMVYPGPSPYAARKGVPPVNPPAVPKDMPPSFSICPGTGDRVHAVWAIEYYNVMLAAGVPNIEMHLYGNGTHGGAGTDRGGIPLGSWQYRFVDWFRDLGFLQKPGVETKAARDVAAWMSGAKR